MTGEGFIDAEGVRAAARDAIARGGPTAAWVRDCIEEGALSLTHATTSWAASHGDFSGHTVTLAVDAAALAHAHLEAVAREVLVAALCGAASHRPRESIVDATLLWDGTVVHVGEGYREARRARRPATLEEAVRAWLDVVAPGRAGELPEGLSFAREEARVVARGPRPPADLRALVEPALRALCGVTEVRWRA